jgi:hypothetical protein
MTTAISKLNNLNQKKTIITLVVAVSILMLTYLHLVSSTAFSAAAYERISDDIIETQSQIGELELVYIEKTRAIEKELGQEFSLVKTAESDLAFAKRNVATKLTFNE